MLLVFFLKGIVVGAVIAVPVGPVGILCLRRSIFEGQAAGLVSGLGAATADAFFGVVAAFGLTFVSKWLFGYENLLRAAGGCYPALCRRAGIARAAARGDRADRPRRPVSRLLFDPGADHHQPDHDPRLSRDFRSARL